MAGCRYRVRHGVDQNAATSIPPDAPNSSQSGTTSPRLLTPVDSMRFRPDGSQLSSTGRCHKTVGQHIGRGAGFLFDVLNLQRPISTNASVTWGQTDLWRSKDTHVVWGTTKAIGAKTRFVPHQLHVKECRHVSGSRLAKTPPVAVSHVSHKTVKKASFSSQMLQDWIYQLGRTFEWYPSLRIGADVTRGVMSSISGPHSGQHRRETGACRVSSRDSGYLEESANEKIQCIPTERPEVCVCRFAYAGAANNLHIPTRTVAIVSSWPSLGR
ncbi:hypothetical protein QBC34DRAFT_76768 [Podospora aff. communis PSN243]|uniref:Uncharacterized protein n=1 Tax=Podospora aff. communis PSN243 TaxID=3040156 RepID=A0AAV9GP52_9PEZI|nr:hypothetical protein QBC34DRAFT_76768 [Podospora aff. communis PSN243]